MKVCKRCNTEKDISSYGLCPSGNHRGICKQCYNPCKRNYDKQQTSKGYDVYMLPNADYYVGQTYYLKKRLSKHRTVHNRDTSDYIILHHCDTREEALWYESVYHKIGCSGLNNGI